MSDFDLRIFLPYLLNQAAEAASLEFQQVYKERYGMLRTEWRVLFHLGIYQRLTASEIAARARMHKTKISRAVSKLEERRFLARSRDAGDRRVEWLTLTPAGQAAYTHLRGVAETYDTGLADQLGPKDLADLKRILQNLADR